MPFSEGAVSGLINKDRSVQYKLARQGILSGLSNAASVEGTEEEDEEREYSALVSRTIYESARVVVRATNEDNARDLIDDLMYSGDVEFEFDESGDYSVDAIELA